MELVESLNRTIKLAMDEGKAGSYEEAKALFATFRLRISVGPGFAEFPAAEAALLTLLNAAPRTFLGGVEVDGPLNEQCTQAWFAGLRLAEVADQFGVATTVDSSYSQLPTVVVGAGRPGAGEFSLGLGLSAMGFELSPDAMGACGAGTPVEVGVAAAGAALNEVFQHVYRRAPLAGQREVRLRFPILGDPRPARSVWTVGLGHLGQAFLWTAALSGHTRLWDSIRLTDYDTVSRSSLSTCLLVHAKDVGRKKVDVVAERLETLGMRVTRDPDRLNLDEGPRRSDEELVVIAVDNVALRRSLDSLHAQRVLEAGIGDGIDAFTRTQMHEFPGSRKARDIWVGDDVQSSRAFDISMPAYQSLLKQSGDECGTTLVAGRSVATPFVGGFTGALLSWLAAHSPSGECAWNYDVNSL